MYFFYKKEGGRFLLEKRGYIGYNRVYIRIGGLGAKIGEFRPKLTQFHDLKFSSCKFSLKFSKNAFRLKIYMGRPYTFWFNLEINF